MKGRWTVKYPIDFGGGAANLYGYTINDAVNMLEISTLVYFGSQNGYVVMREFIKLLVFIVLFAVAILLIWCFGPLPTSTELVKQLVEWMGRIHC